jgi:hypothetical protein
MLFPDDQLVLGRGRVYFEPFSPGTRTGQGERYIGNTISFQVTREIKRQARMISVGGKKFEDFGRIIEESHKVTFVTENIDLDNIADFFGLKSESDFLSTGFVTETFVAKKGRFYQLGKQFSPIGVRHALTTAVKVAGVVRSAADWDADTVSGRLYIPLTSTIADGATITVEWESRDQRVRQVVSQNTELWGALRFISDNAEGGQKNVLIPCVRLFARGAIDLKGDQWQQLPFEADVTHLTPAVQQVYLDFVDPLPGQTTDEKWFEENFISGFIGLEDLLDIAINIEWPIALTTQPAVYFYDVSMGLENPVDAGRGMFGVYDLLVDGVRVYLGLNAPWVRPDIVATTILAYRSELTADQDYLLRMGGGRIGEAIDDLVLEDDDIWSVGP